MHLSPAVCLRRNPLMVTAVLVLASTLHAIGLSIELYVSERLCLPQFALKFGTARVIGCFALSNTCYINTFLEPGAPLESPGTSPAPSGFLGGRVGVEIASLRRRFVDSSYKHVVVKSISVSPDRRIQLAAYPSDQTKPYHQQTVENQITNYNSMVLHLRVVTHCTGIYRNILVCHFRITGSRQRVITRHNPL